MKYRSDDHFKLEMKLIPSPVRTQCALERISIEEKKSDGSFEDFIQLVLAEHI